jgi:putative ABC transport system permease protein
VIGGALRGVRRRAGVSIGLFLIAVVGVSAAAAGPVYDAAARTSILRDNLTTQPNLDRTLEVDAPANQVGLGADMSTLLNNVLAGQLGGPAALNRMFEQVVSNFGGTKVAGIDTPISSRTGICQHVRIVTGTCPTATGQVLVSTSFAAAFGVHPGSVLATAEFAKLTVTGEYAIPSSSELTTAYWLTGACSDFPFPHELPCTPDTVTLGPSSRQRPDAMFTPQSTFASAPGDVTLLYILSPTGVRGTDLATITSAVNEFLTDPAVESVNASAVSDIPQLTAQVAAAWDTLDVPVFLITCQVLVLAWLLLYLIGTDAAESRAGEVALAKLRGHGRLRTVMFGLSEPVLVFLLAFPVGAAAGWLAAGGLRHLLLRPGTPVTLPLLAIAAAAAATLGGFAATTLAARRALVRPVTEQWQHASRTASARGWVLDSILLTCAVAGLGELFIGGYVSSARAGSLALLVPGLLGLAAAVVTSRLLPQLCRLMYETTRRHGGTGLFLAVRHIARRPGGTRTTIVLTAAFALATFAVAAFAVDVRNVDRVAAAQEGADTVLTVQTKPGQDLGAVVDQIDPGGNRAVAVERLSGTTSNGAVLLAVQPQRFAHVAQWQAGFLNANLAAVSRALSPPTAPIITFPASATELRIQVSGATGLPSDAHLNVWVYESGIQSSEGGQTPVDLGPVHNGLLTGELSGCPCGVTMVSIDPATVPTGTVHGQFTMSGLAVLSGGNWTPLPAPFASLTGWSAGPETPAGCTSANSAAKTDIVQASSAGLAWSFGFSGACSPAVFRQDRPDPLPAILASPLTGGSTANYNALGLDNEPLNLRPVALAAAVPGAPADGIIVDLTYAERASYFADTGLVDEEVWVVPGALPVIKSRLAAAGVSILGTTTTGEASALLLRQGPALASVLFLAAAVAAVLLAAGAAVLSLYQAGRRRRYEYAALIAGRVQRRSVWSSVLIEQAVVLGFGAIAGVAAGLGSAALVLQNLPVFVTKPIAPPLLSAPPAGQVLIWLLVALVLLAGAATLAAAALIRGVRPELLREVPP